MILPILDDLPEFIYKLHDLSICPTEHPCVQGQNPSFQAIHPIPLSPSAQVFQLGVFRPRAYWPNKAVFHNVYESGFFHPSPYVPQGIKPHSRLGLPDTQYRRREVVVHLIRLGLAIRICIGVYRELRVLEPPPGFEMGVGLRVEKGPVRDASRESSNVDVVEEI